MKRPLLRLRIGLWASAAAGAIVTVVMIAWAAAPLPPVEVRTRLAPGAVPGGGALALSAFASVWDLDLRRPLRESTPATAPASPADAPDEALAPLKLVGTVVEPGRSLAFLLGPSGRTELKAVGGQVAGATVEEINDGAVTILWNGRRLIVPLAHDSKQTPLDGKADVAATPSVSPTAAGDDAGKDTDMRAVLDSKPTVEDRP